MAEIVLDYKTGIALVEAARTGDYIKFAQELARRLGSTAMLEIEEEEPAASLCLAFGRRENENGVLEIEPVNSSLSETLIQRIIKTNEKPPLIVAQEEVAISYEAQAKKYRDDLLSIDPTGKLLRVDHAIKEHREKGKYLDT